MQHANVSLSFVYCNNGTDTKVLKYILRDLVNVMTLYYHGLVLAVQKRYCCL